MPKPAIVSRNLSFTFGPGQEAGIDNVTAIVTREMSGDPLSAESVQVVTSPVTVQLPADA